MLKGGDWCISDCHSKKAMLERAAACQPPLAVLDSLGRRDGTGTVSPQELVWRHCFLDPTVWWDARQHKKSTRYMESKEVLWLNNCSRPPTWVDAQLVPPSATLPNDSGPSRVGGYETDATAEAVSRLCDKGQLSEAVDALGVLVKSEPCCASTALFYRVLKCCVAEKNLVLGGRVHELTVELGYESGTFLANHILRMYASHGRLQEAMQVFTRVAKPDVFSWSAVIAAHAKLAEPKQAIQLYQQMRCSSVKPDCHVFVAALQACTRAGDLEFGRQVHADLLKSGVQPDLFVWNCLLVMYAKCGRLADARTIFDSLVAKDVVTWTTMVAGYAEHEQGEEALSLYEQMEVAGVVLADPVTLACLLKACSRVGALQKGKQLHSQILERGLETDIVVCNSLVDMYAKCGNVNGARIVFDSLTSKNVVTWNAMITGYAKCGRVEEARILFGSSAKKDVVTWTAMIGGYADHGHAQDALALYNTMQQESLVQPNSVTFACLLKACATLAALQQGKQLHAQIVERGMEADIVLGTCLVHMYAKCGRLDKARRVFDSLRTKNVVTWNAMISGFGQSNEGHRAIECFQEMMRDGVEADETTYTCLLVACSHAGLVKEGQQLFRAMVEEGGIMPTTEHYNCMVDLFGRAGHLDEAEKMVLSVESNDVGVTSLLNACRSHRDVERGVRCFENLLQSNSPPSAAAYVLMGNIYADAGRWWDVERIEKLRKAAGASKKPAVAGIEVDRHVHTFVVGGESGDISSKVSSMRTRLKEEGGHVPHMQLVLKRMSQKGKEDELCGHAEKLALAYGLLNTPDGTPLLVTKNLRMCGDCHSSTEIMSRIEKREIVVRDAHRVHRFVDGSCQCGGRP